MSIERRTDHTVTAACQVRIVQDLRQLPEAEWESLVRGRPAWRLEVLRAIVANATEPLPLTIFLLEDHSGLAAAAVCVPVALDSTYDPLDRLLLGRAAGVLRKLGVSTRPVLVFQIPLSRQAALLLRPADAVLQQRRLDQLLDRIESYAAELKSGIAFVGVTPEDAVLWTTLRRRRYPGAAFQSTARLEIQWSDFESYVGYLRQRSKSAAQNARTERTRNRKAAVDIRQVACTDVVAEALYVIARDHHRHRNGRDPMYGPQFLPQLSRALGDDLLLFEAVRNGERVAMLAVVRSGTVGWVAMVGIEQRDRPNDFTYANIMFYYPADWAPPLGLATLLYGTAAQEAKVRRGCRLLDCYIFYRPRQRLIRLLTRPYLALHRAWHQRKKR
ncbi:MAG TPA: GNAT family N-acetyltransferase [Steroidobacteraceae bacterium]|jgi:predicted N-acyltransferase